MARGISSACAYSLTDRIGREDLVARSIRKTDDSRDVVAILKLCAIAGGNSLDIKAVGLSVAGLLGLGIEFLFCRRSLLDSLVCLLLHGFTLELLHHGHQLALIGRSLLLKLVHSFSVLVK